MNSVKRSEVPVEFQTQPDKATERQEAFIRSLLDQRVVPEDIRDAILGYLARGEYGKSDASNAIERLQTFPRNASQHGRLLGEIPQVEQGRYALVFTDDGREPVTKFYRVRHGKKDSRWEGFVFLDAGRGGAHGDLQWTPIKDIAHKKRVLDLINNNPREAGVRFGREVGACYRCGRSLTQEHTRAAGIGDECAGKV